MPAIPITPEASTDVTPVLQQPAQKSPFPIRTLLLGFVGILLTGIGGVGAGATLVHDPLLSRAGLNWFRYGHGQMLAIWLVYIGIGLLTWAWVRLGRHVRAGRVGVQELSWVILVWILPLLVGPPLFSKDVYSYLSQGDLALHGLNPYLFGPAARPGLISDNVSLVWQNTPAPYGPLFVLLAKGVMAVVGSNLIVSVVAMRLVMVIGFALMCWSMPGLCRHLGGNVPMALWLTALNPLILIHLVGGAHNDMLMVGLLAAGVLLVLDRKHVLGISLITMAFAIKATAAVALPFIVWIWAARLPGSPRARFLKAAAGAVSVFTIVFTACTLIAGVDLGWIPALQSSSTVVNWLSLPTGIGQAVFNVVNQLVGNGDFLSFIGVARLLGWLLLAAIIVNQWWKSRDGVELNVVRRTAIVLAAVSMLAPATMPWYFSWGLALAAALPWAAPGAMLLTAGSIWLVLVTYPAGPSALYDWKYLIGVTLVAMLAAVSLVQPDPLRLALRTVRDIPEQPLSLTKHPAAR